MRIRTIALPSAVLVAAGLVVGTALGHGKPGSPPADATWTTVFASPISVEGLTLDAGATCTCHSGEAPPAARSCGSTSTGGADQAGVTVARMNPPCNPAGLAFGPDGRLYLTGFGAAGDEIGVVTPSDANPASPPVATGFATGTPGANGVAFDEDGNLYVSDGGTAQGRVFRVGPTGGAATVLFRVPTMANSVGVGRQNQALQPRRSPGDARDRRERVGVRPGRRALRRRHRPRRALAGRAEQAGRSPHADRLRHDVHGRHALPRRALRPASRPRRRRRDRARPRRQRLGRRERAERDRRRRPPRRVAEFFRNPVGADSLRNAGPLEFPTSPVLAERKLCTTSSDGNRRDNSPNSAGEAAPGTRASARSRASTTGSGARASRCPSISGRYEGRAHRRRAPVW